VAWIGLASANGSESRCASGQARHALDSFVRAFNSGATEKLDSTFAEVPEFIGFGSAPPGRFGSVFLGPRAKAELREDLVPYLDRRHRHGDRMAVTDFEFSGNWDGRGNMAFSLKRRSPGFRSGSWFEVIGKGALICSGLNPVFAQMQIGAPEN